jgi:hypothetical protein
VQTRNRRLERWICKIREGPQPQPQPQPVAVAVAAAAIFDSNKVVVAALSVVFCENRRELVEEKFGKGDKVDIAGDKLLPIHRNRK